ncbi:MAG: tol-pal system protein YbgF [Pseudomonadota bacterium]
MTARRSAWLAAFVAAIALSGAPIPAQDRTQTLADIRQELTVLFVEMQRLRTELSTTGGAQSSVPSGDLLTRLDALEAELRRLSGASEALELRVDRVVRDGTTRVGDLEFRLCELETACDIATLSETTTLGGGDLPAVGTATLPPAQGGGQSGGTAPAEGSLAVAEQSDFDRAQAAFDAGEYPQAAQLFAAFTETYPGGPLSAEAHFLRGEAHVQQANWSQAARAFLDSFSGSPESPRAPQALVRLGTSLAELGQVEEGCLTLLEVERRYPTAPSVVDAQRAMAGLRCN